MTSHSANSHMDPEAVVSKLLAYCRANQWSGFDPYDALNSRLFQRVRFLNARVPRLIFTQALKRSPLNIRGLVQVPKTQNPKALALFLTGLLKLSNDVVTDQRALCAYMVERLTAVRSPGARYWCWGYSFPWQTRENVVPAHAPNLVCTTFVANALLDAYEADYDLRCLDMATSAAEYILNELYWADGDSVAGFSYPLPSLRVQVHNANFLAAALLCRIYKHTRQERFLEPALKVARYSASQQQGDGSWYYGEASFQRWIDNFHTGFNLCALQSIKECLETPEFDPHIRCGFDFYTAHFFREDGAPKYFHNRTYPVDIHCVAQSIITLLALRDLDPGSARLAHKVVGWALKNMWDVRGFFYYRVSRLGTIRTSYMRWSQAWMFLALSAVVRESNLTSKQAVGRVVSPVFA